MSLPTPNTPGYTSFRGRTCCNCLAEWLPVFEGELKRRGVIAHTIDIAQLTGSADASAGVHSRGGAFDIWQHDDVTVWVARQMGAPATWARRTGSFANNKHTHGVLQGCEHNEPARYQIAEVYDGGDGLAGSAPDPGPRPIPNRTWREGIVWALEQGDDMASPEVLAQLDRIEADGKQALKEGRAFRAAQAEKNKQARKELEQLSAKVSDDATKAQVQKVIELLTEDDE